MRQSLWPLRLAIAIAAVLYAVTFRQWTAVYTLGAVFVVTIFPFKLEIDRIGEWIVGLLLLVAAYVSTVTIGPAPKHPISEGFALARAFTCFWAIAYACLRMRFHNPWGGHAATLVLPAIVITACGGDFIGKLYHALVAVFSIVALVALSAQDPSRPSLQKATKKRKTLLLVALPLSTLLAVGFTLAIPPFHQWLTQRFNDSFLQRGQTGFTMYFRVGSLTKMYQSEKAVLRVHGRFADTLRLRGLVYNRYHSKHWSTSRARESKVYRVETEPKKGSMLVERIGGDRNRYFAPLDIDHISVPGGNVGINDMGLLRPMHNETPNHIAFTFSKQRSPAIGPPVRADSRVFGALKREILPIAQAWTKGLKTPREKIQAMVQRLQKEYKYSLSFTRPPYIEPIVDFLKKNKQGHCEYFASALALLSRALGIPSRVIGGYLVYEYNNFGGYYIVREKNAHAWVEVWLPNEGWQTFDATPSSGVQSHMRKQSTWVGGGLDVLRVLSEKVRDWFASLTLFQSLTIIGIFVGLWFGIRLLRRFRTKKASALAYKQQYRTPLQTFEDLMQALQPILPKRESETIEHYARRLRKEEIPPHAKQAAQLLLDYAALRYGQLGSEEALQERIQIWLQEQPTPARQNTTSSS
ncbi:MAG: DUF3488 domain-containing protein [Myxococcales bacterium]|nr:DUF3488 domain-containing protein [Myxococcales bacterium]